MFGWSEKTVETILEALELCEEIVGQQALEVLKEQERVAIQFVDKQASLIAMQREISEVFEEFKQDMQNPRFEHGRYLNEKYYRDDHSSDVIRKAQKTLYKQIVAYLKEHAPNRFIVIHEHDIMIMSVDMAQKHCSYKNRIEEYLVRGEEYDVTPEPDLAAVKQSLTEPDNELNQYMGKEIKIGNRPENREEHKSC